MLVQPDVEIAGAAVEDHRLALRHVAEGGLERRVGLPHGLAVFGEGDMYRIAVTDPGVFKFIRADRKGEVAEGFQQHEDLAFRNALRDLRRSDVEKEKLIRRKYRPDRLERKRL